MDEKKVIDLKDDELINELAYCYEKKDFYYNRYNEVIKEMIRRSHDGKKC